MYCTVCTSTSVHTYTFIYLEYRYAMKCILVRIYSKRVGPAIIHRWVTRGVHILMKPWCLLLTKNMETFLCVNVFGSNLRKTKHHMKFQSVHKSATAIYIYIYVQYIHYFINIFIGLFHTFIVITILRTGSGLELSPLCAACSLWPCFIIEELLPPLVAHHSRNAIVRK